MLTKASDDRSAPPPTQRVNAKHALSSPTIRQVKRLLPATGTLRLFSSGWLRDVRGRGFACEQPATF